MKLNILLYISKHNIGTCGHRNIIDNVCTAMHRNSMYILCMLEIAYIMNIIIMHVYRNVTNVCN